MALTLMAYEILAPVGELTQIMFPGESLDVLAGALISAADGVTTDNATAKHWIYWRAYTAIANRLAATPNSEVYFNDVARRFEKDRLDYFLDRAAANQNAYEQLAGVTLPSPLKVAKFEVY